MPQKHSHMAKKTLKEPRQGPGRLIPLVTKTQKRYNKKGPKS